MGRPTKPIDATKVRQLAGMGLTGEEIAAVLDCSEATLMRRFATPLKEGRTRLNASLKRTQFRLARKNVAMAIWLGKQYLGQRDQPIPTAASGSAAPRIVTPDYDARSETPSTH